MFARSVLCCARLSESEPKANTAAPLLADHPATPCESLAACVRRVRVRVCLFVSDIVSVRVCCRVQWWSQREPAEAACRPAQLRHNIGLSARQLDRNPSSAELTKTRDTTGRVTRRDRARHGVGVGVGAGLEGPVVVPGAGFHRRLTRHGPPTAAAERSAAATLRTRRVERSRRRLRCRLRYRAVQGGEGGNGDHALRRIR